MFNSDPMKEIEKKFRAIFSDLDSLNDENFFLKINEIQSKFAELSGSFKDEEKGDTGVPRNIQANCIKFAKEIKQKVDSIIREKKGQIEIVENELISLSNHKKINLYNRK
jgi:hypothetical protein